MGAQMLLTLQRSWPGRALVELLGTFYGEDVVTWILLCELGESCPGSAGELIVLVEGVRGNG